MLFIQLLAVHASCLPCGLRFQPVMPKNLPEHWAWPLADEKSWTKVRPSDIESLDMGPREHLSQDHLLKFSNSIHPHPNRLLVHEEYLIRYIHIQAPQVLNWAYPCLLAKEWGGNRDFPTSADLPSSNSTSSHFMMPRSHQTFRPVPAVTLSGIMLINKCWSTTFHIITVRDADEWCRNWLVWSTSHDAPITPNFPYGFGLEIWRWCLLFNLRLTTNQSIYRCPMKKSNLSTTLLLPWSQSRPSIFMFGGYRRDGAKMAIFSNPFGPRSPQQLPSP